MTPAQRLLRSARRSGGLSQRALAERAHVHQPAIAAIERGTKDARVAHLDRLLRGAGHRLTTLPTWAPTAADTAEEIAAALAGPDGEDRAFRALLAFNDGLTAQEPALRVALCVTEPAPTADRRFDAALAAMVEHNLAPSRLPVPRWVRSPERTLDAYWVVDPYAPDDVAEHTPKAFRRHGILLDAAELASV